MMLTKLTKHYVVIPTYKQELRCFVSDSLEYKHFMSVLWYMTILIILAYTILTHSLQQYMESRNAGYGAALIGSALWPHA